MNSVRPSTTSESRLQPNLPKPPCTRSGKNKSLKINYKIHSHSKQRCSESTKRRRWRKPTLSPSRAANLSSSRKKWPLLGKNEISCRGQSMTTNWCSTTTSYSCILTCSNRLKIRLLLSLMQRSLKNFRDLKDGVWSWSWMLMKFSPWR